MSEPARDFPQSFVFGAATAAYQVEGGIENDWTDWERAGKTRTPCGRAVDHWNRWEEDFDLLGAAGLGAYRLSVEWARVEPEPGRFDDAVLARYRAMLEGLSRRGIKAMVTLHHFTHPRWFHQRTPWTGAASVEAFAAFSRKVAEALRGRVSWWCTLNEPMVFLLGGYVAAQMPPGLKDLDGFAKAAANLMRAHLAARRAIREADPGVPVGIAHNSLGVAPLRSVSPLDRTISRFAHDLYNHAVPRALIEGELRLQMPLLLRRKEVIDGARGSLDFLGVNYYSRIHVGAKLGAPWLETRYVDVARRGLTDLGWECHPEGFGALLEQMKAYGVPLYITENGLADESGERRSAFLYDHLKVLATAMRGGADVRGYFHWSLLDNFEWLEGLGPRFGLYRVDFQTLARTATPTVAWLKRVAQTGRLATP
ncbi:MAG: family 1 glycosylhydrolase [Deltaproteobacteria bacterium]|nr:family 1 glycosylhydrolase [Deltaproteobacteria bacterium]